MAERKAVLIFGVGSLQHSIIQRAKQMGMFTVGIDPLENAACRGDVDAYEVVGGQDYESTLAVARKYRISAIVTAATDKPLVMMARVAKKLGLPFFSVNTAVWSTDKYLMKQRFLQYGIPCAKGILAHSVEDVSDFEFPVIVKPRDNSGSRGVKLCADKEKLEQCIGEALLNSHLDTVLIEEYIEGQEYSIESIHYEGKTVVVQFTEKTTTSFPYNVELCHKQPANLSESQKLAIQRIIEHVAECLHFDNCPSHTEIKINNRGIFVIETSPRLGGDFITSTLVPCSTGFNMEDAVLRMAFGKNPEIKQCFSYHVGVVFFSFKEGREVIQLPFSEEIFRRPGVVDFSFLLKKGQSTPYITSSLNRYGHLIVIADSRPMLDGLLETYVKDLEKRIYDLKVF